MAHILIMPRQGNTVESCIITDWKVKEGDNVTAEAMVCEVETDKASFEVPAGAAGTVLKLLFISGDDVPVLQPIAVIGAAGEDWKTALGGAISEEDSRKDVETQGGKEAHVSPRARNLAEREALPLEMLSGTGPISANGPNRIIERDVAAALQNRPPLTAAAKAAGPVVVPKAGSGIGGRVTAEDLAAGADMAASSRAPFPAEGAITETPIKGIRKIIADRMFKSLAESAQLTLNASAPAAKLQEIRSRIKMEAGFAEELGLSKITINDLILFAVSRTLPRFPFMNAHKTGETIKTFERVQLAVAVDTPKGLMVPVIRNADLLSPAQISSEAKRLAAACQNGTANPDELTGSTFTVSNLGSFGITSFTPILNAPEVAILGVCGIELKPVTQSIADQSPSIVFEPHIGFSLTINHEAVDGAPAARFLKALGEAVTHIDLLLAAG
jgi:pyruvate dehydrogenase E2 component (dihydrolipoamide acetyltransferase)